jgi:hypothetical protein
MYALSSRVPPAMCADCLKGRRGVFLDPELFLALVRPLINTAQQLTKCNEAALLSTKSSCRTESLRRAFDQFGSAVGACVARRAGDITLFVELLEWCGLMCELRTSTSTTASGFFVPVWSGRAQL